MPRDTSIRKVLLIGSGPIVIGQAAEFDYSGTQACLALRDEGIEVVLLNNNPATLMTDPALSHRLYMEPLTPSVVEAILERERPDGILANLGGQVGLNLALALHKRGSLRRLGVRILGTDIEGIARGEDREAFRELMHAIGEPVPQSATVQSVAEGLAFAREVGFPLILRPAFTLGGEGSGIAHDERELEEKLETALTLSPIHQVLVEESIVGWKEIEFEGLRDITDEVLIVTAMENVDPMGIHTGDSIVVAPAFTVPPEDLARMAQAATRIYRAVGLIGGANIQFAYHPERREYRVIEINPRVSRSSALASKATGYPIAWATTKLALGYALRELPHPMLRGVSLADPPVLRGQVVLKVPRFAFDKFPDADRSLGTTMKATGEVLAIDESFEAALAKGVRSLEIGAFSLTNSRLHELTDAAIREELARPTDRRLFVLAEAIRRGMPVEELARLTAIDSLFLRAVERIVREEEAWSREGRARLTRENLARAKALGLSDAYLAKSVGMTEAELRRLREDWEILPDVRPLDTRPVRGGKTVGEIARPYFYFTYASFARELGIEVTRPPGAHPEADAESPPNPSLGRGEEPADPKHTSVRPPVGLVLGSGPIRIGQGIEFDYASVHALWGLKALGYAPVVVNNNPETVSTDASVVDRLYIAPLTVEDVWEVVRSERPEVILAQFGGQTSLNLALPLLREGAPVADVNLEVLTTTEGREEFYRFLDTLGIPHAEGRRVFRLDELEAAALELGFPLLVRPSFVIGGEAMRVLRNLQDVAAYVRDLRERGAEALLEATGEGLLLDRFLDGIEFEIDLVTDGWEVLIPGVFRHIEGSGIHSGDSHAFFPAPDLPEEVERKAREISLRIVRALGYRGAMNIQFIYDGHDVYVLEVNPRVSRTLPIAGKVRGTSYLKAAVHAIVRGALPEGEAAPSPVGFADEGPSLRTRDRVRGGSPDTSGHRKEDSPDPLARPVSLKVPVFSHRKIRGAFVHLGPEMTSTGEALVFGRTAYEALAKAYPIGKNLLKGGLFFELPHRGLETRPGNASGPYGLSSPLVSDVRRWREMYRELSEKGIPLWLFEAHDADSSSGSERGRPLAPAAEGFRHLSLETARELIRGEVAFLYAPWPDDAKLLPLHHELVRLATLYGVPVFLHPDLLYASLVAALNPAVDPDLVAPLEEYALGVRPDAGEPSEARKL